MSSSSISRRVDALEAQGGAKDRCVAGVVRGRGQHYDTADQDRIDQKVAGLHAAGYSVVYVANLAAVSPQDGARVGRLPEQTAGLRIRSQRSIRVAAPE